MQKRTVLFLGSDSKLSEVFQVLKESATLWLGRFGVSSTTITIWRKTMAKQNLYTGLIGGAVVLGLTMGTPVAAKDVAEAEVPEAVMQTFKMLYPNAVEVEWELKKVHMGKLKGLPIYEVEFQDSDGVDHEMLLSPEGKVYKSKLD
jgi:hypothetical protein